MNLNKPQEKLPDSVSARVYELQVMPIGELKDLWRELFSSEPPTNKRPYLVRRLGYQLQENEFRKSNPKLLESNEHRIEKLLVATAPKADKSDSQSLEPGTLLIREYREETHQVKVMLDGDFEYRNCRYKSLSEIARLITGTRWSGPLFFGLKQPAKPKKAKKTGGQQ